MEPIHTWLLLTALNSGVLLASPTQFASQGEMLPRPLRTDPLPECRRPPTVEPSRRARP